MLQSGDVTIVKEGAQLFSDAFAQKKYILRSYQKIFCSCLEELLVTPEYSSVCKWILKCTCYYSTPRIEKICEIGFFTTKDPEVQNWMISTIASRYTDAVAFGTVIDAMRRQAHTTEQEMMLDRKNVFYNVSVFGRFSVDYNTENIGDRIFRENDKNGKFWLAKLAAYPDMAQRKNLLSLARREDIERMAYSDDEEVQVYAYWGMVHHPGGDLQLKREEKKDKNRKKSALKWYFTGIIPGEYKNNNLDYIIELLISVKEKYAGDIRAKEGILKGLNMIPYNSVFDELIIGWYYSEDSQKIKIKILEYMIKNVRNNAECEAGYHGNGSFFEIISDECLDDASIKYIKRYIDLYKTLFYKENHKEIQLSYEREEYKMSKIYMPNAVFHGPVNLGDHGTIDMHSEYAMNEKALAEILKEFIKECKDEKLVSESESVLKSYETNQEDWKGKALALKGHLADFVSIVTAAPQVIKLAQQAMEHIGILLK